MINHTLSEREKNAIDAILSQAESEYFGNKNNSNSGKNDNESQTHDLQFIDNQCKSIWPDWDPKEVPKTHKNTLDPEKQIKQIVDIDSIIPLNKNTEINIPKSTTSIERTEATKFTDTAEPIQIIPPTKKDKPRIIDEDVKKKKKERKDFEEETDPKDMEILRRKMNDLVERINNSVTDPDLSPDSQQFVKKMRKFKDKYGYQINSQYSKPRKVKNEAYFLNGESSSESSTHDNEYLSDCKTKAQAKKYINNTSRKMKIMESENKMLKEKLKELKKSLSDSQKEIEHLKVALRKSEAVRAKLLSLKPEPPKKKKPRRLDLINPY